jgi:deoxyribodipyrimidine photo-lyase
MGRGERWFALKLNDYELSSNNGGWQWAASTGCDAQPWFRIFNPVTQSKRFDPDGDFIRRWLPQLAGLKGRPFMRRGWRSRRCRTKAGVVPGRDYPLPIVDHEQAREKTLQRFKAIRDM